MNAIDQTNLERRRKELGGEVLNVRQSNGDMERTDIKVGSSVKSGFEDIKLGVGIYSHRSG